MAAAELQQAKFDGVETVKLWCLATPLSFPGVEVLLANYSQPVAQPFLVFGTVRFESKILLSFNSNRNKKNLKCFNPTQ